MPDERSVMVEGLKGISRASYVVIALTGELVAVLLMFYLLNKLTSSMLFFNCGR